MMTGNYNSRGDFHRVNYADRCRGCGSDHGCTYVIHNGWRKDLCLRNLSSERFARDGRAIHQSRVESSSEAILEPPRPIVAPIKRRDSVYRAMLNRLTLGDKEKETLLKRGLTEEHLATLNYKSTKDIAQLLDSSGFILDRVPGFYKEDGWKANVREGFFIPVRDSTGQIQAFQMRTYNEKRKYVWFSSYLRVLPDGTKELLPNGASSGAPIHWVKGQGRTVYITEGILKADVIGMLTGLPVLGKAGVDCGNKDIADASLEFDRVVFAYDQDWQENNNVRKAMVNQYRLIRERSGIPCSVATWPKELGKGLDDYLLGGETKIVVSDFESIKEIYEGGHSKRGSN